MRWVLPVAVGAVLLVAWQFLPSALHVKSFIVPTLSDVVKQFISPEWLGQMLSNLGTTMVEALSGFAIGCSIGVIVGLVLGTSTTTRLALYPYIVALQAIPKVALAPLFVVWFGFGTTPKIIIVVVMTFFPVLVNTLSGVMGTDRQQVELFQSLRASRRQMWVKLYLPSSLPAIFAGLEVAAVLSLLGAIVGEFVSAASGMGVLLVFYQNNYNTAAVFALLIVLAVVGMAMNGAVILVRKWVVYWQK